jgi:hypothetical protein
MSYKKYKLFELQNACSFKNDPDLEFEAETIGDAFEIADKSQNFEGTTLVLERGNGEKFIKNGKKWTTASDEYRTREV